MLVSLSPLHAMEIAKTEKSPITGYINIAGSVAYGPKTYYKYLNKSGISTEVYEPLVQVDVVINDTDESNNAVESLWTNHENDYELDSTGQWKYNERKQRLPYIISKDGVGKIQEVGLAAAMKRKYFPSYIPVRCFSKITGDNHKLTLSVYTYPVSLRVLSNLRCNFINQINDFIAKPLYFKWKTEGFHMTPLLPLIEGGLIKEQASAISIYEVLDLCGHNYKQCPRYCTNDKITYEHGEKGKEVVEQLKVTFEHLRSLTGTVLLWPQQEKDKDDSMNNTVPFIYPRVLYPDMQKFNELIERGQKETYESIYEEPSNEKNKDDEMGDTVTTIASRIKLKPNTQKFNEAIEKDEKERSSYHVPPYQHVELAAQNFGY